MDACIKAGVHYLDPTAEFDIFLLPELKTHDAARAGIMIMSGPGWDVVPSDCLGVRTSRWVPEAEELTIAPAGNGRLSAEDVGSHRQPDGSRAGLQSGISGPSDVDPQPIGIDGHPNHFNRVIEASHRDNSSPRGERQSRSIRSARRWVM